MLDRSAIVEADIQESWSSAPRDRGAHLGVHYATVSRQLKRTEEESGNA